MCALVEHRHNTHHHEADEETQQRVVVAVSILEHSLYHPGQGFDGLRHYRRAVLSVVVVIHHSLAPLHSDSGSPRFVAPSNLFGRETGRDAVRLARSHDDRGNGQ